MHVSWGYKADGTKQPDEQDELGSTPRIRRLEFEGTRDICPWLTVPEAIDFQAKLDFAAIRSRQHELARYVRNRCDTLRLVTPTAPALHGSMTAFWVPTDLPADEVRRRLWDARIEIPVTDWPDGRIIRLSGHFYTTKAEVDRFVEVAPGLFK
jgi:isopenicillin-N epimerase